MARHHLLVTCLFVTSQLVSAKVIDEPRERFSAFSYGGHSQVSARHAYYSYHPPTRINFVCRYCANSAHYPVYHYTPPSYIYKLRESNDRYAVLLAGLSLYNLGRCCGYEYHHAKQYTARADEECSMQIVDITHTEETRFPCFMMSSFMEKHNQSKIFDALSLKKHLNGSTSTAVPAISFDILSANVDVKPYLVSNGSELEVRRDQECIIWHNMTMNKERHTVPCALLKDYAETMKPAGVPVYIWMPILLCSFVGIYVCCYCCFRKRKDKKEDMPLNQSSVYRNCSN